MFITCRTCHNVKSRAIGQKGNLCQDCWVAYYRAYRAKNLEWLREKNRARDKRRRQSPEYVMKQRARGREYWRKLRHDAVMAYGGYICACCGETRKPFLSIDHINNDGATHRRTIAAYAEDNGKGVSSQMWQWLKRNGYPAGFQILCMNCNFGKAKNGGVCPHESEKTFDYRANSGKLSSETIPSQAAKADGVTTSLNGRTGERQEVRGAEEQGQEIV